jgi:hypothetical protein
MINQSTTYKFELPDNAERASQWPFNRNFVKLDENILPTFALKTELSALSGEVGGLESELTTVKNSYTTNAIFTQYQAEITQTFANYYKKSEVDTILNGYVTTSGLTGTLKDYVTSSSLTTTLSNYVKVNDNDYITGTAVDNKLSSYVKTSALTDYVKASDLTSYAKASDLSALEARVKALEDAKTV